MKVVLHITLHCLGDRYIAVLVAFPLFLGPKNVFICFVVTLVTRLIAEHILRQIFNSSIQKFWANVIVLKLFRFS